MAPAASSDPRSWLLSQPQLLLVLFAGAAWLFKMIGRAKKAASGQAGGPQEAKGPELGGQDGPARKDTDDEEHTRRVRQDILRKIAERRAGAAAPKPPAIVKAAAYGARGSTDGTASAGSPVAQMIATSSPSGPIAVPPASPLVGGMPGPSAGSLWLDDLRSRDTVRRAILVREILGPPIALRR